MKSNRVRLLWSGAVLSALMLYAAAGAPEVERVFAEIVGDSYQQVPPPKQHRLLEQDLNAYIAFQVREQQPRGIQEITLQFKDAERVATRMLVDVDQLGLSDNSGAAGWLGSLMSGTQRLDFEGQLTSEDGNARYRIESVRLNGFPLPVTLVESLLDSWGSQMEPPINFNEPFQLPYRIRRIEILQGYVVIHTGALSATPRSGLGRWWSLESSPVVKRIDIQLRLRHVQRRD